LKHTIGKIGIIGNGSWGTALAKILTDNGFQIHWWLRNPASVAYLQARHHNQHYLTSVKFAPETIVPSHNLAEVVHASDTLLIAVPSAYVQDVLSQIDVDVLRTKNIISAIKGILPDTNLLLCDYLTQHLGCDMQRYMAITGPCHAEEVADERLSYLTFSGLDTHLTQQAAQAFHVSYINTTHNCDIWGAQFAAVLKNIYALGAGIARGLDYGDNFLSVYITSCYREMYRFLNDHFKKAHPNEALPDFHTSAYLGDLLVTCYSLHSRNRTFGTMIGKGYSVKAAILEMNMVAEGYYAAKGMQSISKEFDIQIPIATSVFKMLYEQLDAAEAFQQLEGQMS